MNEPQEEVTSVSVLVSTRGAYTNGIRADKVVLLGDVAKRFELTDYDDKDEFMVAVDDYVVNELKDTNPDRALYFFEPQINLVADDRSKDSALGLISSSDINEDLWELMSLDKESMSILFAWVAIFDMTDDTVELTLHRAKEHYVGYFDDTEALGKHYVDTQGSLEPVPTYLHEYIDYDALGESLMENSLNSRYRSNSGYIFNNY